jgi:hypothetical protein
MDVPAQEVRVNLFLLHLLGVRRSPPILGREDLFSQPADSKASIFCEDSPRNNAVSAL